MAAQQSDAVMVTYNLQEHHEEPVIDYCREHNKAVLIKKALASGHITQSDKQAAASDPVQASMDFLFAHAGVTSAIVGTINPKHLSDNVAKACRALSP